MLRSVLETSQTSNREVMAAVAQLAGRMTTFLTESQDRKRMMTMQELDLDLEMMSLNGRTREEEAFTLAHWNEKQLRRLVNNSILEHLTYEMLPKRYEAVAEAHPKTFEWAFQDVKGTSLSTWLEHQDGLFWISGKPGSGKSTLMKHILDDYRTRISLEKWARRDGAFDAPLIMASFFFWNSGSLEQRSQIGMLRSLLFQVFEQKPELISVVLPSLWLKQYGKYLADGPNVVWSEKWSLSMLMTAFKRLASQPDVSCKLFILIDGLDEFDGDHELLAELLNEISKKVVPNSKSSVKLCVSSRPYVGFQQTFEGHPTLRLQDLTSHDITIFVQDRFLSSGAFRELASRDPEASTGLTEAVVSKSHGVFLWVFIVVKDLLKGIRNRDNMMDLWRRVDSLPRELEPLYLKITSEIDPSYLVWTSKAIQIIRASEQLTIPKLVEAFGYMPRSGILTVKELYYALNDSLDISTVKQMGVDELEKKSSETEYYLTARCACLLEVHKTSTTRDGKIQYLHRTAKDFLEEPKRWAVTLEHTRAMVFDPWWSMLRSKSLLAHRFFQRNDDSRDSFDSSPSSLHEKGDSRLIADLVDCAMKIDLQSPFYDVRMRILNDIEVLLEGIDVEKFDIKSKLLESTGMWYDFSMITGDLIVIENLPYIMRSPLLDYALLYNVSEFVAQRLTEYKAQNARAARQAATVVLHYSKYTGILGMDMAIALFKQGANMNVPCDDSSMTLWASIVSDRSEIYEWNSTTDINPIWPQFISTALAYGADPSVLIGSQKLSLDEFVHLWIRPKYPAEAAQLHEEIRRAFRKTKRRSYSVELENAQDDATNVQKPQIPYSKRVRRH